VREVHQGVLRRLARLERDGLVHPSGTRPGTRKPNITYGPAPEAERLFPKVYGPTPRQFLEVLAERLPAKKREDIARAVGHRLAAAYRAAVRSERLEDRVAEAVAVLGERGGGAGRSGRTGSWSSAVSTARWRPRWPATPRSVGCRKRC